MTQPTAYDRQYDFQAFQTATPSDPLPAAQIAAEYNAIKLTIDELLANLALIQRDDTAIINNSIGFDQLKSEVSTGVNPATGWLTSTAYAIGDMVFDTLKLYRCLISHTSGTFATDLTAVKWLLVEDFTATANSAATTTYDNSTSGLAAVNVKTALDEIVVEKLNLTGGTMSGVIAMGTSKITGVGNGTALQDVAAISQLQNGIVGWADGAGTADAITSTYSPTITAEPEGMLLGLRAASANATTTPTFKVDGLTARTIVRENGVALAVGDIAGDGHDLLLRYDLANTQWLLLNPATIKLSAALDPNGKVIGWAKGADIASASPLVMTGTGNYHDVTGTTGFAAMTVAAGRLFVLQFDGALTLTHHATNLNLPGGANITTATGDHGVFYATGVNTVHCVQYTKADGTAVVAAASIVSRNYSEYTAVTGLTTAIVFDDTIPDIAEGTEVLTATITPSSTSNRVRIRATAAGSASGNLDVGIALFVDATAPALAARRGKILGAGGTDNLVLEHEYAPSTTSTLTFRLESRS